MKRRRVVIHAYTQSTIAPTRLNEKLCGARGGSPYVTGHISEMTCGNCLRLIRNSQKLSRAYSFP